MKKYKIALSLTICLMLMGCVNFFIKPANADGGHIYTSTNYPINLTATGPVSMPLGPLTDGQIIVGSTGAQPLITTLSSGTGISVTNGAGSITVANSAPGVKSVVVSSCNAFCGVLAINTEYLYDGMSSTWAFPEVCPAGSEIKFYTYSTSDFDISLNVGQIAYLSGSQTTSGGNIQVLNGGGVTATCLSSNVILLHDIIGTVNLS